MKLIFTLVSSFVVAGLLGLLLVAKGVVQITDGVERANLQSLADEAIEQVSEAIEKLPLNTAEADLDKTTEMQAGTGIYNTDQVADVHSSVLLFLNEQQANNDGAQLEEELYGLLIKEYDRSPHEAAKYVQMCFWRYFVTFQQSPTNTNKKLLWQEFMKEKELKQAGFKARGLEIPVQEIKAAEEQFENYKEESELMETDGGKV